MSSSTLPPKSNKMARLDSSSEEASSNRTTSGNSTEVTLDFGAGPGTIAASAVVATTTNSAGRSDGVIHIEHPKNWKSPEELGVVMPANEADEVAPAAIALKGDSGEPVNNSKVPGGRERSLAAIKSTLTPAAAAAASAYVCSPDPSLVTSVNYKGQEVLFGTLPRRKGIVGWCARTRVTLQTLDVPDGVVVQLLSHPGTGLVVSMFSNGECRTYYPRPTPAQPGNELSAPFGRYRWINGPTIQCRDFVVTSGRKEDDEKKLFRDDNVKISASMDHKLLVAYQNQICVFDVAPRRGTSEDDFVSESKRLAELVWTTQVDGVVTHARVSGDGRAIVYTVKGEGVENDNPFGCRMFVRDEDDGTSTDTEMKSFGPPSPVEESKADPERVAGPGILFKPGPFLIHEASVSFLSFRGFGCNTSDFNEPSEESNDLLLTYCEEDNSVRVFSQNSWKQLMQWTTPPQTRADWVRGSSLFNLGDLEPNKKKGSKGGSAATSRRPSLTSNEDSDGSAALQAVVGTAGRGNAFHHHQNPTQHHPCSAAGAWIAEVTFRSAFPALRLSRLSYMKRGSDDAQPAHFESVAAILPAGSVFAESVLPLGDMGMTIDGIWPALNPLVSDSVEGTDADAGTLKGSAMAFLGLNNVSPHQAGHGYFGESPMGGTHSPPSELRLAASHPLTGKVVVMEFPLWGDQDFGAMELGSPLRYLLSLGEIGNITQTMSTKDEESRPLSVGLDYETSILSARIEKGSRTIGITWRKQGTGMLLPLLPCTPLWKQPKQLELPRASLNGESDKLQDVSTVPIPLSLPSLRLPKSVDTPPNEKIQALAWWPDENYGGPPQLLAITGAGSLYLYEMPPPWSALEPAMPSYDPFSAATTPSNNLGDSFEGHVSVGDAEDDDSIGDEDLIRKEYEVMITPHPDFGIGLRLEGQLDGLPAVAGSYKKHPLNGGMLPAEKTGMIVLGDELLSVNGVTLEGITFDEIIATVRQVGGDSPPHEPLSMRFRSAPENRRRANSSAFSQAGSLGNADDQMSHGSGRRTREEIIGIKKKGHRRNRSDMSSLDADKSMSEMGRCVTLPSGVGGGEMQQEFSRIIASILGAIPTSKNPSDLQNRLALMPWTFGLGAPDPHRLRCAALLVVAEGSTIHAMRLEVAADCDAEKARCKELGTMELQHGGKIEHLEAVKTGTDNWCVAVWDSEGHSQLVFIDILERPSGSGGKDDPRVGAFPSSPEFRASFRRHAMFDARSVLKAKRLLGMRAHAVDFVATLTASEANDKQVVVWTAKPSAQTSTNAAGEDETTLYADSVISLQGTTEVVDFRFLSTGSLETAPRVVVFTRESVVVFQVNPSTLSRWEVVLEVGYPRVVGSSLMESYSMSLGKSFAVPSEVFPHLLDSLRGIIAKSDDKLVADWHPNSVLSSICCNENGVKASLKTWVKAIFTWMARDESEGDSANYVDSIVDIIPWSELSTIVEHGKSKEDDDEGPVESAATLMAALGRATEAKPVDEQRDALEKFQEVLEPPKERTSRSSSRETRPRKLPSRLGRLNKDERLVMWGIGELISKPPKFGKLDESAQLALFGISLMGVMQRAEPNEEEGNDNESSAFSATFTHPSARGQTNGPSKPNLQFSSSCTIAALTSDTQNRLLEVYLSSVGDFDWAAAKAVRLPFWLRSDGKLRKLSEEVGQQVYRQKRDIMECAIFFIVARNRKKLAALSATDKSETGRKFFKFLSSYDFSSIRGRKAAEKNAYSLLRKHKYNAAAAFFLLPEPPMVKTALETIVTKTNDLDMAFLVARLVESSGPSSTGSTLSLSMMGGGGGYAVGFVPQTDDSALEDKQTYIHWNPKLGKAARNLLQDRGLSMVEDDMCLSALQLMWLGRREEAAHSLSGATSSTRALFEKIEFPADFDEPIPTGRSYTGKKRDPFSLGRQGSFSYKQSLDMLKAPPSDATRAASKANKVINFVTRPFLAKAMRASARAKWTCSLLVGNAMTRRGIELPASRCMLSTTHPEDLDSNGHACAVAVAKSTTKKDDKAQPMEEAQKSPLFDSLEGPPPKLKPDAKPTSHQAASSIFDSFDTPRPRKPAPKSVPETSSIFDDFVVPKQSSNTNGETISSIFDEFTPAPQKPPQSTGGDTSSSIFDKFTPAPPPAHQKATGQLESSIFDSFNTAPQKPKPATTNGNGNGSMASSIFDSFDAAPQKESGSGAKQPKTMPQSKHQPKDPPGSTPQPDIAPQKAPLIYLEWRNSMLANSIARRVLREVARLVDKFHGNSVDPPMKTFSKSTHPLVPLRATEVLRAPCDGDSISSSVKACVEEICAVCEADEAIVVEQALRILDIKSQPNKIVIAVLLHSAMDRVDLAEDIVRDAALGQIHRCESLAVANDDLVDGKNTLHHASSLFSRRVAARVSWQLELCLWLHRGGVVPLSGIVLKETIVAVRAGLVVASWGRNHECLESMMRCEPDCKLDYEGGKQLWSSLKLITGSEEREPKRGPGVSSGGWEFLVDCRRDEATQMLRSRPPGSFIIRPHPQNNGVFTLSFKTNLVPPAETADPDSKDEATNDETGRPPRPQAAKPVKKDDVVQHAIIRLSDAGFRCGSFGPFTTLLKLLEAVSTSLPFDLLFDKPPTEGIIKDEDGQPSPNAFFFRKFALSTSSWNKNAGGAEKGLESGSEHSAPTPIECDERHLVQFGLFAQLLTLTEIRRQLSAVAAADYEDIPEAQSNWESAPEVSSPSRGGRGNAPSMSESADGGSVGSLSLGTANAGVEEQYSVAARILRPLLVWCRGVEMRAIHEIAPILPEVLRIQPVAMAISEGGEIEVGSSGVDGGDVMVRNMIQPNSGVEFRTLRVGEGGESAMIILFSKKQAIRYLMNKGGEDSEAAALERLHRMEKRRVIEAVAQSDLALKGLTSENAGNSSNAHLSYRIVDPWEVEAVESREGETASAALGREHYYSFSVSSVSAACVGTLRKLDHGPHLLGQWTSSRGGMRLTKSIASVHPPWERDAGGDLPMQQGQTIEPTPYVNSIRQHLYRNAIFRRLLLPQRFMALLQVELLDLKNLNTPTGASLSVYALLRLKRHGSSAPLSLKARTLDSAATLPIKIQKLTTGTPNAPASWGSLVRFRFPLPEDVNCDGISFDKQREALFRGPPSVLQFSVYEKKFMSDIALGGADVKLDALANGGQLEEWVPLRSDRHGINWFARIRLTLRFELLCLPPQENASDSDGDNPPSVGLRKIQQLSRVGGAHEDPKHKKSASTPDLLSYFESMVY